MSDASVRIRGSGTVSQPTVNGVNAKQRLEKWKIVSRNEIRLTAFVIRITSQDVCLSENISTIEKNAN